MKKYMLAALCLILGYGLYSAYAKGSNKTQVAQNLNIFNALYRELQMSYVDSLDSDKNIRNAIDAMLGQIDPYTEYYPVEEQDQLMQISSGEFSGIGSIIAQRNGYVYLSEPQWGSPARAAGAKAGDILLAIDGDTLPYGYTSSEASKRLRGQAGTNVHLTVKRPYAADSIVELDIVRGKITTNPVPYYGMVDENIGYISLTTFNEKSASLVKEALNELKKNPNMKSLVLDLRDNGGGLLESAVEIVGYFVPKGTTVVTTKSRDEKQQKTYKTSQSPIDTQIPLVVLVNGNTASAAEIVSGSLQDLDRAVIIGERSYGKGLVQTQRPLPYDGLLKLTVARYYIPSGRLIQAIDYSHRNPDGTVARIPDSLTNVYHTVVAGREVRDGGGITPDVKVQHPDMNRLIYNMIVDNWVYDYATRFAARQGESMPDAQTFVVGDSIFSDFKAFIDPNKFDYDKLCETGLKYLRDAAESEGYMTDSVAAQFNVLEGMLKHNLNHDLDHNRTMLITLIDDEISARYYSDGDRVMRNLTHDQDLDSAKVVLNTPLRYQKILQPSK